MKKKILDEFEIIAKVCHAANRAYCQELGDMSQPIWECSPGWQRESSVEGVKKVLANPDITPEQCHDAWVEHKIKSGWKYGPKKDERKKEHPCLLDYAKLSSEQRRKDAIFSSIVKAFIFDV